MRCQQCGLESAAGAAFCARCGTRLMSPRPEARREYAVTRIRPSWWRFGGAIILALMLAAAAAWLLAHRQPRPAAILVVVALILAVFTAITRRSLSWSITSERLIERRGLIASRRRELELADIRSVEVEQRLFQRLLGLGSVMVASAASADFMIRLEGVRDPEAIADTLRKARLKRLA